MYWVPPGFPESKEPFPTRFHGFLLLGTEIKDIKWQDVMRTLTWSDPAAPEEMWESFPADWGPGLRRSRSAQLSQKRGPPCLPVNDWLYLFWLVWFTALPAELKWQLALQPTAATKDIKGFQALFILPEERKTGHSAEPWLKLPLHST